MNHLLLDLPTIEQDSQSHHSDRPASCEGMPAPRGVVRPGRVVRFARLVNVAAAFLADLRSALPGAAVSSLSWLRLTVVPARCRRCAMPAAGT
jgi:hypothetical protein